MSTLMNSIMLGNGILLPVESNRGKSNKAKIAKMLFRDQFFAYFLAILTKVPHSPCQYGANHVSHA